MINLITAILAIVAAMISVSFLIYHIGWLQGFNTGKRIYDK